MRKDLIALLCLLTGFTGYAQLTGTKSIPGDYATIASAISSLNSQGVGSGGVTFNVAANHKEILSSSLAGHITTQTGSLLNPIVFQKSGSGANPLFTASAGTGDMDAIFAIEGCDYITFDGFNIQENMYNGDQVSQMEWGFAILKSPAGDNGAQHVTIRNCTITLEVTNTASTAIYINNHTANSFVPQTVTSASGTNSNLKIYSNTINNCYRGIYLYGYNSTVGQSYGYYDQDNEIGKDGANIITHIGGGDVVAYGIYAIYQNNLKVANNVINSTTEGSATVYGIYLTTASNASYDLYGNSVSIQFSPSNGYIAQFYPIYCDMGGNGSSNIVNVYNNLVTGCTYSTVESAPIYCIYLNNLGVTSHVYGNVVSNNTLGAVDVTANMGLRYFWVQQATSVAGTLLVHDNTVTQNARVQSGTSASGTTQMLAIVGSGATAQIYNNTVSNNSIGTQGSCQCLYVTYNNSVAKNIYGNTVVNISNANGSTQCIYNANGATGNIYNNRVQNVSSDGYSTLTFLAGINHSSGANMFYYNNMISELYNTGSVSSLGYDYTTLVGINIESSADYKTFYNNTVYLNSPTFSSQFGSAALMAQNLTGVTLKNNILVNTSASAGLGRTTGMLSRTSSYTNFTSNYNNIYAGTPGPSNLIFVITTNNFQTLPAYKAFIQPNEIQSVTELPPFVNIAAAPYDVHIKTNVPTQCEAGGEMLGSPAGIAYDYDGNPRFPTSGYPVNPSFNPNAPDIGADEFGGLPNDLTAPAIYYTPLTYSNTTTPRTLTATIIDGSGVPTSGFGVPVLYWNINNNSYLPATGSSLGNNTWSFTFGGGVSNNDTVRYYIAAQDIAPLPNVGTMPFVGAAGFSANPPACSTPPTTPSKYYINQASISGVFHVGAGKAYPTITAAFADLNGKYIVGPVTFILDDNQYPNETFPLRLNANPGNSAVNNLTIKPNTGANPVITGSKSSDGLIICNGLDFVTINGSNNGTDTKNLTIENTSSSGSSHTIGITNNNGTNPSTNITIKNCILKGSITQHLVDTYIILFNFNGGLNGGGYDNCTITNNTIIRAKYAIDITASVSTINRNIVISNNAIGSFSSVDFINRYGIAVNHTDNAVISCNDIMGPAAGNDLNAQFGVLFYGGCTHTKIIGNKIHDWFTIGTGCNGIKCDNAGDTTITQIYNNLIYNIKAYSLNQGLSQSHPYGIFVRSGGNLQIWHNTIFLSGPYLEGGDSFQPSSACIGLYDYAENNIDIRNNVLRNSMTNPTPNPDPTAMGKAYGIIFSNDASHFSGLDYNEYHIDGHDGKIALRWGFSGITYDMYTTLPEWQNYTAKEANSLNLNPGFVSDIDLHVTNDTLNNAGGPRLLLTDYSGNPRYNPTDMGAYEWSIPVTEFHTLAATDVTLNSATLHGDIKTNGEWVTVGFEYGTTTSYGSVVNAIPPSVRSVDTLLPVMATVSGLLPNTTYHFRFVGDPTTSSQTNVYGDDMTFTTGSSVPVNTTGSGTISNDTCLNATQVITVGGNPPTFTVTPTGHVTMIAGQKILILPGTTVMPGGFLHAYISDQYCGMQTSPFMTMQSSEEQVPGTSTREFFKVYPNPTTGSFEIELNGDTDSLPSMAEVYSMTGNKILSSHLEPGVLHNFSIAGVVPGVYFIRVSAGNKSGCSKLIKL